MRHLVLGTAGHIDHGKSTLVHALTGTDPDRLQEEKRRGITIDLGFADLELAGGRVLSFVDVPGHERFVRHMVAGATGIDAVLLVVAADEGVKPQTREHLDICSLLGLGQGVVVLTKCDLVEPELREVVALELRDTLAGTFLADAPLCAVSARSGEGLDALLRALEALFDRVAGRPARGAARLPVDRSFVLHGFGTVVTGTLAAGRFREGDEVEVLPGGPRGRIRGIQVHRSRVAEAAAGRRTALNLQGLDCDQAPRGATITHPGALAVTRRIRARLRLLDRAPETLRRGGPVRFHHGTCERAARLRILGADEDGTLRGELLLRGDTVLVPGDPFILRRPAPVDTVGGGFVVDVRPPRRERAWNDTLARATGDPELALLARIERSELAGSDSAELGAELGLPREEIEQRAEGLELRGDLVRRGGRWFGGARWRELEGAALGTLERLHRDDPLRAGIPREELRAAVARELPQEAWRAMLEGLATAGRVRLLQDKVALAGHQAVLSAEESGLADRLDAGLRAGGLDPPAWDALVAECDRPRAARVMEWLAASGKVVRIPDGRWFHAAALDGLRGRIASYATRARIIDVAGFKELAGVTRKNAIPLLEYLDAERVTRRRGNVREIL